MSIDPQLTLREEEILCLLREGYEYKQIGIKLGISRFTIKGTMRLIYAKLNCSNPTRAVIVAIREGLITLKDTGV